jgi:hypothetical protein
VGQRLVLDRAAQRDERALAQDLRARALRSACHGGVERGVIGGTGLARPLDRGGDRQPAVAEGLHAAQRLDVPRPVLAVA